jgi:hypothetical protein
MKRVLLILVVLGIIGSVVLVGGYFVLGRYFGFDPLGLYDAFGQTDEENYFSYSLSEDGSYYTIDGGYIPKNVEELELPTKYDNLPVKGIRGMLNGGEKLVEITIPEGYTTVNASAFMSLHNLETLSIPDSIEVLYDGRSLLSPANLKFNKFDNAEYLGNKNNKYLVLVKPSNTSIESCTVNDKTKIIIERAFADCEDLTSLTVPSNVTSMGSCMLAGCDSLESLTLPFLGEFRDHGNGETSGSQTSIGSFFESNDAIPKSLKHITLTGGTRISWNAFAGCKGVTEITLPDTLTVICGEAFKNCTSLKSIVIPDSVTFMESNIFSGCTSLMDLTLPYLGSSLDSEIYDCNISYFFGSTPLSLKTVTITGGSFIGHNAFSNCSSLKTINLPSTITSVGESAFAQCSSLESIDIPNGVTEIRENAFYYCTKLESINLPDSIELISNSAFLGCNDRLFTYDGNLQYLGSASNPYAVLMSVTDTSYYQYDINPNTRFIRNDAFSSCYSLQSVYIPEGVTRIGSNAFYGCSNLSSVSIPNSVSYVGNNAFNIHSLSMYNRYDNLLYLGNSSNPYVYLVRTYENTYSYNISETTKVIGEYAFYYNSDLSSINIPNSVVTIGKYAFYGCNNLSYVQLGLGITNISEGTFLGCSALTSITLPNGVTSIGGAAFDACSSLEQVDLPQTLTHIDGGAFASCSSLRSIYIPDSVTYIGNSAFANCYSLTDVTVPESVTFIGNAAFSNCTSLKSITVPFVGSSANAGKHTTFGYIFGDPNNNDNASYVPSSLTTVIITGGTHIDNKAFYQCTNIESITLPDTLVHIGSNAFESCTSLESIEIPASVNYIGRYAFESCPSLESVVFNSTEWRLTDHHTDSKIDVKKSDLSDTAKSATALASKYSDCTWEIVK